MLLPATVTHYFHHPQLSALESFDYEKQLQELLKYKKQHANVACFHLFSAENLPFDACNHCCFFSCLTSGWLHWPYIDRESSEFILSKN